MTHHVLIPVPGLGVLKLTQEAFAAALTEGAAWYGEKVKRHPKPTQAPPRAVYTVKEWCADARISRCTLYLLWRQGKGQGRQVPPDHAKPGRLS